MEDTPVPDCSSGEEGAAATQVKGPAKPPVPPGTLQLTPHVLPVKGQQHSIGWQASERAGPCFVVVRIRAMGDKILDRFPLTADGWAKAWAALVKLDPGAAQAVSQVVERRLADQAAQKAEAERQAQVDAGTLVRLRAVAYLGGYVPATGLTAGQRYDVRFLEDRLLVVPCDHADILAEVPYSEIEDVDIGGPGLVRTGGGFVGGGFGVQGAAEGMAIASVLNALTTRTSIQTIVRIQGTRCELFLLHTKTTPAQLRIELSHPLAAIRSTKAPTAAGMNPDLVTARPSSPVEELVKLADMLEKGLLTRAEFELMKAKVVGRQI